MKSSPSSHLVMTAAAVGLLCLSLPEQADAQGGFATGFADPGAMNELNQMGGATPGTFGIDRARAVAGGQQGDPFAQQQNQFGGDPFGPQQGQFGAEFDGGFGPGFDPAFGGGEGFGPGFQPGFGPQQQQQAYRPPPTVRAFYGDRIICPITGQILQDAVEVNVLADRVDESYFNDGRRGGDFLEGDDIWTNVTTRQDEIAPEAGLVRTRMVRALELAEGLDPAEFHFEIRVASTDPLSNLPQVIDLEEARDEKIRDWAPQFLNRFRTDPDDPDPLNWDFRAAHVPTPPALPESQLPPNFRPPVPGPFTSEEFDQYRQAMSGSGHSTGGGGGGGRGAGGGGGGAGREAGGF